MLPGIIPRTLVSTGRPQYFITFRFTLLCFFFCSYSSATLRWFYKPHCTYLRPRRSCLPAELYGWLSSHPLVPPSCPPPTSLPPSLPTFPSRWGYYDNPHKIHTERSTLPQPGQVCRFLFFQQMELTPIKISLCAPTGRTTIKKKMNR